MAESARYRVAGARSSSTERYLGTRQNLVQAVNDNLPVEPDSTTGVERVWRTEACNGRVSRTQSRACFAERFTQSSAPPVADLHILKKGGRD